MKNEIETQKSGAIVLNAIKILSSNGYGWTSIDEIYKFANKFFNGGLDTKYESGVPVSGIGYDLNLFKEIGLIGNKNGAIYPTKEGKDLISRLVINNVYKERFYKSLKMV